MSRPLPALVAALVLGGILLGCDQPTEPVDLDAPDPGFAVVLNAGFPFARDVFIPCALDGAGEIVSLSGTIHVLITTTQDATGGIHFDRHAQPQNMTGVGQTSGASYQGTGVTRTQFNAPGLPYETTFVDNFRIIGQGSGNNLLLHTTMHQTFDANGNMTADILNTSVECR